MPSGNYGTGGYGLAGNSLAVSKAAGASHPYVAIAQFLVGAAATNIGGAIDKSQENNDQIVVQGRKDINSEHSSPFGVADEMGAQMFPGAEKMLSANTKPLAVGEGGFTAQPLNVDSSQPAYSSQMQNYLNYMRYRP